MKIKKRSIVSIILAIALVSVLTVGALTAFASNNPEEGLYDSYNAFYESYYEEEVSAILDEPYLDAIPEDEDDLPVYDEPDGWDEWLEWYNSLSPEQQSQVSLSPPQEGMVYAYPIQVERQNPYRIAATLEEVWAIIALQDGTIPLTNIDVPEIRNRQVDGIIILEQCLYEAMDVLLRAYAQSGYTYASRNLTTTRVEISPAFEEMPYYMKVSVIRHEFFRAAMDLGLVYLPLGTGRYGTDEEFYRSRDEARRLLELYDGEFPSEESIRESAQRLFGD